MSLRAQKFSKSQSAFPRGIHLPSLRSARPRALPASRRPAEGPGCFRRPKTRTERTWSDMARSDRACRDRTRSDRTPPGPAAQLTSVPAPLPAASHRGSAALAGGSSGAQPAHNLLLCPSPNTGMGINPPAP